MSKELKEKIGLNPFYECDTCGWVGRYWTLNDIFCPECGGWAHELNVVSNEKVETLHSAIENVRKEFKKLFELICKKLKIPEMVKWLSEKLK